MTTPMRMNQLRNVNTTPIVPYCLLSSTTASEKKIEENRARPSQSAAVTTADGNRTRQGTRPASRKCIVHQKNSVSATNLTRISPISPVASRTGPLTVVWAASAASRASTQAIARGTSRLASCS
jgi:hypothetical protein